MEIDRLVIGYMAGLVDGEGNIGVSIAKPGGQRKNPSCRIRIKIAMCDIDSIEYIRSHFGGKVSFQKRKNPKHRGLYEWTVRSNEALFVLRVIEPYLKIKRRQAQIAIELQERVKKTKIFVSGLQGMQRLTDEEVKIRLRMSEEIKGLNSVGVR